MKPPKNYFREEIQEILKTSTLGLIDPDTQQALTEGYQDYLNQEKKEEHFSKSEKAEMFLDDAEREAEEEKKSKLSSILDNNRMTSIRWPKQSGGSTALTLTDIQKTIDELTVSSSVPTTVMTKPETYKQMKKLLETANEYEI